MNISDEAVEAAMSAVRDTELLSIEFDWRREKVVRAALEAAAPHLTRAAQEQAWDEGWDTFAGFDSRPGGPYPANPYKESAK